MIMIGAEWLLPELYQRVLCPDVVAQECAMPGAPEIVREWIGNPPDWFAIRVHSGVSCPGLGSLDPGERSAIDLALEVKADAVLMDEMAGRHAARNAGLVAVGTIGILAESARNGWVDYTKMVARLRSETNFRVSPKVVELGRRHAESR